VVPKHVPTSRRPRFARAFLTALPCLLLCAGAAGQDRPADVSFRVFLRDGTAVVCYGDFARVGDRVIFTLPIGGGGANEQLQVVNLPASSVDLERTEQYALSVRAQRYAATSGEADYAELTGAVATALNKITATNEPIERLQIVEQVRGVVVTWGRDHYGYRANDVREIEGLLDELVSDLRAQAGVNQFDLNLVAGVAPPPPPSLPEPTPADAIEQVLKVARASDVPAERVSLLQAAIRVIDRPASGMSRSWVKRTHDAANGAIAVELRTDRAYRDLARTALGHALEAASRADATAVEDVLNDIRRRDDRLGRKRPAEVAALVAVVEGHLDSARRLRLARDRWQLQYPLLHRYVDLANQPIERVARSRKALDSIRRLAGPDPNSLSRWRTRLAAAAQAVARLSPPPSAAGVHATISSACQMAVRSVELRQRAIESGDLQLAWDASSAAAGALMLLARAQEQLQGILRPPELQ
jgi:hypothetical protein